MTVYDSSLWQYRPDELYDMVAVNFPRRNESSYAWKSVVSQHLGLSGLRGFWPATSFDEGGDMFDLSGQGRTLTYNGNPLYRTEATTIPVVALDGTGDYFSRADEAGLDITGTESYVGPTSQGLTLGGWYKFSNALGTTEYMMSKWDVAGNQRSYRLIRHSTGVIRFSISTDGTAVVTVDTVGTPAAGEWFFGAGRYSQDAAEMDVWYNDERVNLAAGVPAIIHAGTGNFNVGAYHNGNSLMTGRLCYQFLCAALLPDAVIFSIFEQSRSLFRV